MFQVVNERYLHRRPMLFTTNKPGYAQPIGFHTRMDAVLDCSRGLDDP